jgi:iron(III) transport system permease protein
MTWRRPIPRSRELSLAVSLLALLVIGVASVAWLVVSTLADAGLSQLRVLLLTGRQWHLLGNTLLLGGFVGLGTTLVGTPLGLLLAKTDLPWKRLLWLMLMVPLCLPPYILALAWFYLLGKQGLLAAAFGHGVGGPGSAFLFSLAGSAFVLSLSYYPVPMVLVHAFVTAIDSSVEEAARLLFPWPAVLAKIDLPLVAPGIFLGALFTVILSITELGVPLFLRYDVFTVQVFTQFAAFYDSRAAVLFSIPLLVLIAALLLVERYTLRDRFFAVVGRRARREAVVPLGRLRLPIGLLVCAFAGLAVLLPLGALALTSRAPSAYLEALTGSGRSIANSFLAATLGATAITVLGWFLAYLIERSGGRRRQGLDSLLILLLTLPGTVLGVGLILLWNRAATTWLYGSLLIIVLGDIARYTVLATRTQGMALRQVPTSYEEAARLAQVRWGTEVRRIHVPTLKHSLMASWVIAFIFCLRDLDTTMTIYPPGQETLPVRIYTLMANSPESVVAALAVILVLMTLLALTAIGWLFASASGEAFHGNH